MMFFFTARLLHNVKVSKQDLKSFQTHGVFYNFKVTKNKAKNTFLFCFMHTGADIIIIRKAPLFIAFVCHD